MKKFTTLALGIIFASAIMTGCKKDHTCTCKDEDGETLQTYPLDKTSKKDAQSACDTWDSGLKAMGGSCSLD